MIETTQADFFATRVEAEDMNNGCLRLYFYSDRRVPGETVGETLLILTVVLPTNALATLVGHAPPYRPSMVRQ